MGGIINKSVSKETIVYCVLCVLVGCITGYLVRGDSDDVKTAAYFETDAYRKVWSQCKSDGVSEQKCKSLMIRDISDRLNGESPMPDGYVFTFSDSYSPTKETVVYSVEVISRGSQKGRFYPVERVALGQLNVIPE